MLDTMPAGQFPFNIAMMLRNSHLIPRACYLVQKYGMELLSGTRTIRTSRQNVGQKPHGMFKHSSQRSVVFRTLNNLY